MAYIGEYTKRHALEKASVIEMKWNNGQWWSSKHSVINSVSSSIEYSFSKTVTNNHHSYVVWVESMLSKLLGQSYFQLTKQIFKYRDTLTDPKLTLLAQLKVRLFETQYLGRSRIS